MNYKTPAALRMALEQRLKDEDHETGLGLDRLRRRVIFERIVARLHVADPGCWVLKGGMALEVRLRDDARFTKDLDLGLRSGLTDVESLTEQVSAALAVDHFGDGFLLVAEPLVQLEADRAGHVTWRAMVTAQLADRRFGRIQIDLSPRKYELDQTDFVALPNSLAFAGIGSPTIEVIDVHRHAAEKFHGMLRDHGERENSRVRDLVDIVILSEHQLLDTTLVAVAVKVVWRERNGANPPASFPVLPDSWPDRYERLVGDLQVDAETFPAAVALVTALWLAMFPTQEI
ncbi:MAG: nucleotidyl transferase AbiEii/AbiGii toxin family protein [Acidimicrobiia bacterium]